MQRPDPILVNYYGDPTPHRFVRIEPRPIEIVQELADTSTRRVPAVGAAKVYACVQTGLERTWGIS